MIQGVDIKWEDVMGGQARCTVSKTFPNGKVVVQNTMPYAANTPPLTFVRFEERGLEELEQAILSGRSFT